MHYVGMLADSHDEVARFEVAKNKAARMNVLQATDLDIEGISLLFISWTDFAYKLAC
jgi:hypothetical protein